MPKPNARYNRVIEELGGIDLQLLGIGRNGHIGFNEPGAAFEKYTHCVDLTASTIEANQRFFASADDVPRQAYTMGLCTCARCCSSPPVRIRPRRCISPFRSGDPQCTGPGAAAAPGRGLVADDAALAKVTEKGLL